ncbi:MAG: hypothetical protein ACP5R5_14075 [Armatimonadota bacterium]
MLPERGWIVNLILWGAVAAAAACIVGCSSSQTDVNAPPPSATTAAPKVPATGPAISSPVTFDQLALEGPVKRIKKNGLVFLRFAYADNDGKIYNCELPEPMSKGEYTPQEWVRTFNIYRLPKVIGQKKRPAKTGPRVIGDFPFISPRPQPVEKPATQSRQTPAQQPVQLPNLPPPPSAAPSSPPMMPRPMPNMPTVSPRPPSGS